MNKKIYYYFHAGSSNHGCEAIVRATSGLLKGEDLTLISDRAGEDLKYGIDQLVKLEQKKSSSYSFFEKVLSFLSARLLKSERYGYDLVSKYESKQMEEHALAMSIGGDNYCYGRAYNLHLAGLNKHLHKRKIKTILWGCSIEPATVTKEMEKDFSGYDLIVARESISYEYLKKINANTLMACDPAFFLEKEELPLPEHFLPGKTVGINLSPLIQKSETKEGITLLNYRRMTRHILATTDYHIALIPHVVAEGNDDRTPLSMLYEEFKDSQRICLLDDLSCMQLKGYISRCELFIGARTHATIAAYSTGVPTLVIGYSTKAIGIARDLFGSEDHYVLPVQKLSEPDDMIRAFDWLNQEKEAIRKHLTESLPAYQKAMEKAVEMVKTL